MQRTPRTIHLPYDVALAIRYLARQLDLPDIRIAREATPSLEATLFLLATDDELNAIGVSNLRRES